MSMKKLWAKLISQTFRNMIKAYSNFFQKFIEVVSNIAPLKTARIKNTSNDWVDRKIAEKLSIRDKLFEKIQIKSSQHRLRNLQRGKN